MFTANRKYNPVSQSSSKYKFPPSGAEVDLYGSCITQAPAVTATNRNSESVCYWPLWVESGDRPLVRPSSASGLEAELIQSSNFEARTSAIGQMQPSKKGPDTFFEQVILERRAN